MYWEIEKESDCDACVEALMSQVLSCPSLNERNIWKVFLFFPPSKLLQVRKWLCWGCIFGGSGVLSPPFPWRPIIHSKASKDASTKPFTHSFRELSRQRWNYILSEGHYYWGPPNTSSKIVNLKCLSFFSFRGLPGFISSAYWDGSQKSVKGWMRWIWKCFNDLISLPKSYQRVSHIWRIHLYPLQFDSIIYIVNPITSDSKYLHAIWYHLISCKSHNIWLNLASTDIFSAWRYHIASLKLSLHAIS